MQLNVHEYSSIYNTNVTQDLPLFYLYVNLTCKCTSVYIKVYLQVYFECVLYHALLLKREYNKSDINPFNQTLKLCRRALATGT